MGNALSAKCTVYTVNIAVVSYADGSSVSGARQIPYAQPLYFFADLYAAHAFHTLGCVSYDRHFLVPPVDFGCVFVIA